MQMKALLGSGGLICSIHIGYNMPMEPIRYKNLVLGIKIFRTDGRVLYQDDKATYCTFVNGLCESKLRIFERCESNIYLY